MTDRNDDDASHGVAATTLANAAMLAALIGKLAERGALSDADTRELYDTALLMLEQQAIQAESEAVRAIYAAARQIIERPLSGD